MSTKPALLLALLLALLVHPATGSNAEGLKYLKANGKKRGVIVRPSGLQYEVLKSGGEDPLFPLLISECMWHCRW